MLATNTRTTTNLYSCKYSCAGCKSRIRVCVHRCIMYYCETKQNYSMHHDYWNILFLHYSLQEGKKMTTQKIW